jgi:hypothetical protein
VQRLVPERHEACFVLLRHQPGRGTAAHHQHPGGVCDMPQQATARMCWVRGRLDGRSDGSAVRVRPTQHAPARAHTSS